MRFVRHTTFNHTLSSASYTENDNSVIVQNICLGHWPETFPFQPLTQFWKVKRPIDEIISWIFLTEERDILYYVDMAKINRIIFASAFFRSFFNPMKCTGHHNFSTFKTLKLLLYTWTGGLNGAYGQCIWIWKISNMERWNHLIWREC